MKRLSRLTAVLLAALMLTGLTACAAGGGSSSVSQTAATADSVSAATEESDNVNGLRFTMTLLQFTQAYNKEIEGNKNAAALDMKKWKVAGEPDTDENGVQVQYWYYHDEDMDFTATVEIRSDKLMNIGCGTTMSHYLEMTDNVSSSDAILEKAALMAQAVCSLPETDTLRDIFYRTTTGAGDTFWYKGFVFNLSKKKDSEDNKNNVMLFRVFPVTDKLKNEWQLEEYAP